MRKIFLIIFCILFTLSSSTFADTVIDVGAITGSWKVWIEPNGIILPYWDGTSWDQYPINIGYYLKNIWGAGSGWEFWARDASGNADPSFRFSKTNPSQSIEFKIEVSSFASSNQLWWYDSTNPTNKWVIFSGSEGPGSSKNFTPSLNWGFAIHTPQENWFYTESYLGDDKDNQHFAIFRNSQYPETYWIGIEDLIYYSSDKDYQDMVFKLTPVPEPTIFILIASGLLATGIFRRRFKR